MGVRRWARAVGRDAHAAWTAWRKAPGFRTWARGLRRDAHALWLAGRDPRTPWYAKAVALAVAAYAFSPIDLIPDFIPVLGLLDDAVLLPLGILLAVRLIPGALMAEFRAAAEGVRRPLSRAGAVLVVGLWLAAVAAAIILLVPDPLTLIR